jgi:hypothetical protein
VQTGNDHSNESSGYKVHSGSDPFKTWPNSDLLIEEEDRAFFRRHYPAYALIFDWPELRALFVGYNAAASRARKRSRRAGIWAVAAGFLSLVVAATIPLMDVLGTEGGKDDLGVHAAFGLIAALLGLVSVLLGYTQVLTGKAKTRWLINRFWTERLRQLHFQLIVNHLPKVVAAAGGGAGMEEWLSFRAAQLDRFKHEYLRGVDDTYHGLELDEAEDSSWVFAEWASPGPPAEASEHLATILMLLERQRFVIQQRYAERKLWKGWRSPQSQAEWVQKLSDAFTVLLLLATIGAGLGAVIAIHFARSAQSPATAAKLLASGPKLHAIPALIAAIASASVVAMRAMKEGLLMSADAERYRWYLAAVRTLHRRFDRVEVPKKMLLLRELEQAAYQEMRRFILSAASARFVM